MLNIDSSWVDFNKDLICIRIKDMALSFLKLEFVFEVFFLVHFSLQRMVSFKSGKLACGKTYFLHASYFAHL